MTPKECQPNKKPPEVWVPEAVIVSADGGGALEAVLGDRTLVPARLAPATVDIGEGWLEPVELCLGAAAKRLAAGLAGVPADHAATVGAFAEAGGVVAIVPTDHALLLVASRASEDIAWKPRFLLGFTILNERLRPDQEDQEHAKASQRDYQGEHFQGAHGLLSSYKLG